ncbi:hypothetical protein [Alloalcanivorax gelatiniphagus]|nr:hypothetical protein [Alloalcanivorax gelatiniphagus]
MPGTPRVGGEPDGGGEQVVLEGLDRLREGREVITEASPSP